MTAAQTALPQSDDRFGGRRTASAAGRRAAGDPSRRCIVTGEIRPKRDLIRFVVAPDGRLHPDLKGELPGRGLWVLAERAAMLKACASGAFAKAARRRVELPEDLPAMVEQGLRRRCLELIGLARRSGPVAAGFEKARAALRAGKAAALIQAVDAAVQGRQRLSALAQAASPGLPEIALFTAVELGRPLGRDGQVHLVLGPGPVTDRLLVEAKRLSGVVGPLPGAMTGLAASASDQKSNS
ncbi:MAG: RNA-binding protein [Kiloniellales bacterium]|nr:RNA-binding protein [Kiloniellales bacterium]